MRDAFEISVNGQRKSVPAWQSCGVTIISQGRFIKTATIHDEYWLERDSLPNPATLVSDLSEKKDKPDLFTFAQRFPDVNQRFNYHLEWDNLAVMTVSTYEHWYQSQISNATKRNIRASEKRGITVAVSEYDDDYVKGIMDIYNESPIRQNRHFWHYNKNCEDVKKENRTYCHRSTYLAAYHDNKMIGYLKVVWDKEIGAIMQILSKMEFWDKRPNNALLSEVVRQCCLRGAKYLLYEKFSYGGKTGDSLANFKQNNGFSRVDIPRYYVPLTKKGALALRLGMHKEIKDRVPEWITSPVRDLRTKWYNWKLFER